MTDQKLLALIDELRDLSRQIDPLQAVYKEKKKLLVAAVKARRKEHTPTDNGGFTWSPVGVQASACSGIKVTFPAPALKMFSSDDEKADPAHRLAGPYFTKLFDDLLMYRPCKSFRDVAAALLGKKADQLIDLIGEECSPRVSFD